MTETRVLVNDREVVLLSGNGQGSYRQLRAVGEQIRHDTGALVLFDFDSDGRLERLSAAQMREYGWMRVEELERAVAEARAAGAPS